MSVKWTKAYWKATAERVGTTYLEAFVALPIFADLSDGRWDFNFLGAGAVTSLGVAAASLIKNILANLKGTGPSLVNAEVVAEPGRHALGD